MKSRHPAPVSVSTCRPAPRTNFTGPVGKLPRDGGSGLLNFCGEVAGTLVARHLETGDARRAVRDTRAALVRVLPHCDAARAAALVDLALELLHVKSHGRYQRDALALSELIARAGNRLRDVSDN